MKRRLSLATLVLLLALTGAGRAGAAEKATLVFAGDTAFGESYRLRPEHEHLLLGDNRYLPSMKAVLPLLGGAREVLANLETPLALPGDSALEGKSYVHWADPGKSAAALKASGITAVGLANNHTMDLGARGLEETRANLQKAGISTGGAGQDSQAAGKPLLWKIPLGKTTAVVAVFFGFEYRANYDEKFDFYAGPKTPGVNTLDPEKLKTRIRLLRAEIPGVFVIVFPHWGKNYAWRTTRQAALAHEMVDAGADLVIGHGAHQLQEIEQYRGKWILYGLGNFVFHSPGRYASKKTPTYGLVARLDLEETKGKPGKTLRLYPIQCNNLVTGFRTRPVTGNEFPEIQALLLQRTDGKSASGIRAKKDALGFHLEITLP